MTMVLVLGGSLVPNAVFAADKMAAESENSLAQKSAQVFLDNSTKIYPHWEGASLADGQAYYNLDGQAIAYVFPVVKDKQAVGHITAGSSAYDYDVLEAGIEPPFSLPDASELKAAIKRDLGETVMTGDIGLPQLIYLGYGYSFATYEVAFNLLERHIVSTSEISRRMATPEGYRQSKRTRGDTRTTVQISVRAYPVTWVDWNNLPVPSLIMYDEQGYEGEYQNDCGPTSGAMVSEYHKYYRGKSQFPSWPTDHHELYDYMDCGYFGTTPGGACNGFETYASQHQYSFEAGYDVAYSWDYENTIQPRIDDYEPFMVLFRSSSYSQGTLHWCTLRGYGTWQETGVDYFFVNNPWYDSGNGDVVNWNYEYPYLTFAEIWPD
jgi:hypothetical protein